MKKRKRRNFKRFIAAFLVLALMISLVPADVLAKSTEEDGIEHDRDSGVEKYND